MVPSITAMAAVRIGESTISKSGYFGWVIAAIAAVGLAACSDSGEAENSSPVEVSAVGLGVSDDGEDTASETGGGESTSQIDSGGTEASPDAESSASDAEQDVADELATTATTAVELVSPNGPLTATPPAAAANPDRNSHRVVSVGDGPSILEGDTVGLEYVMVSWRTGQVVLSTEDEFGGPQSLVLGDLEVPRYLENSVFQEPVGSRLQVIYAPNLEDLPDGLDPSDSYLLAVDIVSRG